MSKDLDPVEKLFDYIALLEKMNMQLTATLKKCHTLLGQLISKIANPSRLVELLENLQDL